ncbi:hypothetical protein JTE90_004200 [Oedothorax gibbosus]|uniref:Uncharacterized protein n=1 Tax=Oedothorax gibbosus TaxID=931172 RepID=A0AAV6V4Z4_9ARAC|nr:hypothetical protein JTE90_004200 [Oedothorax gibbosus]
MNAKNPWWIRDQKPSSIQIDVLSAGGIVCAAILHASPSPELTRPLTNERREVSDQSGMRRKPGILLASVAFATEEVKYRCARSYWNANGWNKSRT